MGSSGQGAKGCETGDKGKASGCCPVPQLTGIQDSKIEPLSPLPKDYISLYPDFHKYGGAGQATPEMQEEQEYQILNQKSQTVQIVKEPKQHK